jgi:hypothetical protein
MTRKSASVRDKYPPISKAVKNAVRRTIASRGSNFPDRSSWTPEQHIAELERKVQAHRERKSALEDGTPGWQAWQEVLAEYRDSLRSA